MFCFFARKRVSALADGNCPEGVRNRLEAHLVRCPACRAHLADMRRVQEMIGRLERPETSEGRIARRVRQRIDMETGGNRAASQKAVLDWPAGFLRLGGALALAAGLWAGVFFGRAIVLPSEGGRGFVLGLSSWEEAAALYALAVERRDAGREEDAE